MPEYIFTNLPQYIRITPRSDFSNSVVAPNHLLLFSEDGRTITAKNSDGNYVQTGGTDISDTTATPATVLGGYDFYDSTGAKTSGAIPTVSGGTMTPTTSNQIISSGVYLGGEQVILGDANLVGSNILSGISIFGVPGELIASGGADPVGNATADDLLAGKSATVSGGSVISGTIPTVSASLSANVTTVPAGYIAAAQTLTVPLASSATVAGGIVTIPQGYVAAEYTVSAGGGGSSLVDLIQVTSYTAPSSNVPMTLIGQKIASFTDSAYDSTHGVRTYIPDGVNVSFTIADETPVVSGLALASGGRMMMQLRDSCQLAYGGFISGNIISGNSKYYISYGQVFYHNSVTAWDGAEVYILNGGVADDNWLACSTFVSSGGTAIHNTVGGKLPNTGWTGGRLTVSNGGTAVSTTVYSGGVLSISSGGTADTTTVNYWGGLFVSGTATSNTINSGCSMRVSSGGTANITTINAGGSLSVFSGGTALNVTSHEGASITVDEGGIITYA